MRGVQPAAAARRAHKPVSCETCRGAGQVRMQQGFFTVQQSVSALPGPRAGDRRAVRQLPRPGPRAQAEDRSSVKVPAGVDTGDRIRLTGRGRGWTQRWSERRPLRRDPRSRARDLRARRQSPVVRSAGDVRDRDARRLRSRCRRSSGNATIKVPPRRSRVACSGCARKASSPVRGGPTGDLFCRVVGRDAGAPHARAEGPAARVRDARCRTIRATHHPREESWLDGVKRFFTSLGE